MVSATVSPARASLARKLVWPTIGTLAVLLWQFATVTANYKGNWTALFCTGQILKQPPALAPEHIYLFPGTAGFDGEYYHYIAHDPFFRHGFDRYVDAPRLRYRRILVPGLAFLLAAGQSGGIDRAYYIVCLFFTWLGIFWLSEYAAMIGRHRAFGLIFLILPAVVVTTDRMVADGALAAFAAGFALYCLRPTSPNWKMYVLLGAAALTRETGLVLACAFCLYELFRRRPKPAVFAALAIVPCLAWYAFVGLHTVPFDYGGYYAPLSSTFGALFHPASYPPSVRFRPVVQAADVLALLGMLLAIVLAFVALIRGKIRPVAIASALFALIAIVVQRPENWGEVYDFGRVFTPLLLFLLLDWLAAPDWRRWRAWIPALPLIVMLPRLGMPLIPQLEGILRIF